MSDRHDPITLKSCHQWHFRHCHQWRFLILILFAVAAGRADAREVTGLRAASPSEWGEIEASVAVKINGIPSKVPTAEQAQLNVQVQPKPKVMPVVVGYTGAGGQGGVAIVKFPDGSVREVIVGDFVQGRSIILVAPGSVVSTGKDGLQRWVAK